MCHISSHNLPVLHQTIAGKIAAARDRSGVGNPIFNPCGVCCQQPVTGGYKGSKDWTRFYAVMYQAKPFILKSHLQSDMMRIGAATWKAILVNGATKPSARKKKAPIKKSS